MRLCCDLLSPRVVQVLKCKQLIEESKNVEASSLKIIHAGKILADEDTFGGVGVKENDFLVYMAKPKVCLECPC